MKKARFHAAGPVWNWLLGSSVGRSMLGDFAYRATNDGSVHIHFRGRQVTVLAGPQAKAFLRRVAGATDLEAQHLMARATGNFKHGNERTGKRSPRS